MKNVDEVFVETMSRLKDAKLKPYLYNKAKNTNSKYIKFRDSRLGSLRISDHVGRSKYSYRWQIRTDIEHTMHDVHKGNNVHIYAASDIDAFIKHIKSYKGAILHRTKLEQKYKSKKTRGK